MARHPSAVHLASILPGCDREVESEYISLCDIVVTAVEHNEWVHFSVTAYNPEADGVIEPWAVIWPLKDSGDPLVFRESGCAMWDKTVRDAVELYLDRRIASGMPIVDAARMVDGSYTDAVVADSILQFALYGEEIYG